LSARSPRHAVGLRERAGLPRRTGLVGAMVCGAAFVVLLILVTLKWGPLADLDRTAVAEMHTVALSHQWFVSIMKAVSAVGSPAVYAAVFAVVTAWLLLRRRVRAAAFVVVAVGVGLVLAPIVKRFVARPRPVLDSSVSHAGGYSFPSGHALDVTVVLLVLLALCYPFLAGRARALAIVAAIVIALLMGLSRVVLGVHYPSDVAAGYALGCAWVGVALIALRPGQRRAH